jgi:hypothetical protein
MKIPEMQLSSSRSRNSFYLSLFLLLFALEGLVCLDGLLVQFCIIFHTSLLPEKSVLLVARKWRDERGRVGMEGRGILQGK